MITYTRNDLCLHKHKDINTIDGCDKSSIEDNLQVRKATKHNENNDHKNTSLVGVTSVLEFLTAYNLLLEQNDIDETYKIYSRGEYSDFYPTNCIPNIYRGKQDFLTGGKESVLYDRLKSSKYMDLNSSNLHTAFEAQHGGLQTRLLDVSENVLVSLFFCLVEDTKCTISKEDGYVYIYKTNTIYENNSHNLLDHVDKLTRGEITFDKLASINNQMIFINGNLQNRRISKQQGAFILFYSDDIYYLTEFNKKHLVGRIKVDAASKENIANELNRDFGISQHYVYPEVFNAANALRKEVTNYYEKFQ